MWRAPRFDASVHLAAIVVTWHRVVSALGTRRLRLLSVSERIPGADLCSGGWMAGVGAPGSVVVIGR